MTAHDASDVPAPTVETVVQLMAEAVRKGDMKKAGQIGLILADHQLSLCPTDVGIAAEHTSGQPARASLIARGAQGQVFKSTWCGREVAVKVPRLGTTADMERFRREVALMATLGGHRHHIMPLLGARLLPPTYFLVMPLAGPSLAHLLYAATPGWRPTWPQVLHVGTQLATALARMHAEGKVHRDIKPENVLLASETAAVESSGWLPHVLLSDLGLACAAAQLQVDADPVNWGRGRGRVSRPTGGFHKQDAVGTQEYCAPELLLHSTTHSAATDVFALAVTLNELTTLTPPYSDCTRDGPPGLHTVLDTGYSRQQLAAAVAGEGLRPRLPLGITPPGWEELLSAAWATDAEARPTAAALVEQLQRLQATALPAWLEQQGGGTTIAPMAARSDLSVAHAGNGPASDMEMEVAPAADDMDVMPGTSASHGPQGAHASCGNDGCMSDDDPVAGTSRCPPTANKQATEGSEAWEVQLRGAGVRHWDCAAGQRPSAHAEAMPAALAVPVHVHVQGPALHVTAGVVEAVGTRDTWEDRSVVMPCFDLLPQGDGQPVPAHFPAQGSLFAVFDGHRGAAAAELCARQLPRVLQKQLQLVLAGWTQLQPAQWGHLLAAAMRATLLTLEQEFYAQWDGERRAAALQRGAATAAAPAPARAAFPGCTATVALLVGSTLTVGNLGDGGALLGCAAGRSPLPLTRPHTAACARERGLLTARGGAGAVWHDQGGGWRLQGCGLQVSRSIGDYDAKVLQPTPQSQAAGAAHMGSGAQGTGLTAEPEITQVELQAHHVWLVLGSDGLWDVLSHGGVARMVADTVKHPSMTARRLVAEAMDAGSGDNITAVVAFLQPVSTLEKVFVDTHADNM